MAAPSTPESTFINADETIACILLETFTNKNWIFVSKNAAGKLLITMCMKRTGQVDFGEAILNVIPDGTPFGEGFTAHNELIADKAVVPDRPFLEDYIKNAASNIMALSNKIMRRLFTDFKIGMRKIDARESTIKPSNQ